MEAVDDCRARLACSSYLPLRNKQFRATALRQFALRAICMERFLSVAELTALPGYFYHTRPQEIAQSLLAQDGLPVVCLNAPAGTAAQNVAALTYYGLAETPHIVAVLLREQQCKLAQLHPAQKLDYADLRRQLRRLRNGRDVPAGAILAAACGSEEAAARLLHAKLSDVTGDVANAAAAAEDDARRYATLLLIECMKESCIDPTQARPLEILLRRQRLY